ncbi:hypothetical protein [Streptomyces cinereoruber]|uniref:hypothetical protein n=1 Tax=Streptomyces cinereoruber TaxID=67260 RepID=UPI00362E1C5E
MTSQALIQNLVLIAERPPVYVMDRTCRVCGAESRVPCALDCDMRAEWAEADVMAALFDLTDAEFAEVLEAAPERDAQNGESVALGWVRAALAEEAAERGMNA